MKKAEWKDKICDACLKAGTYRPFFDDVIDTLASILEYRDDAVEMYDIEGEGPVVSHTNNGGSSNKTKSPYLVLVMDLNTQALAYWRDLGLTPSGLKKINENQMKAEEKKRTLADILGDAE